MKYILLLLSVIGLSSCTFNKVPVDSAGLMSGERNVLGLEVDLLDYKVGAGVWLNQ